MKRNWWKILSVLLVLYALVAGMLIKVPALPIIHETIRNLFYHVPMWLCMMSLMICSFVYSIKYLSGYAMRYDIIASAAAATGLLFGFLGLFTGMIWAYFSWGNAWPNDAKLNGAAVTILIYLAYQILRNSVRDEHKRAKVAAVYNIFAFVMLIVYLMILPSLTDSLHPGSGGNPAFTVYDLDNSMRLVFYPASIGWILFGFWFLNLMIRIHRFHRFIFTNHGFSR